MADRLVRLEQDLPARKRHRLQIRGKAPEVVLAESGEEAVLPWRCHRHGR
jgi:hypothetical protein